MTVISHPITLHLSDRHTVFAVLIYDSAQPLDVVLDAARPDSAANPWRVFRALFAEGMQSHGLRMAGTDDVRLYRRGPWLFLRLRDGDGFVEVWTAARPVGAFLTATYRLVPVGAEVGDIDAELAELLKPGPRCPTCSRPVRSLLATCRQPACLRVAGDEEAAQVRREDV
jgi:hypothetical protein